MDETNWQKVTNNLNKNTIILTDHPWTSRSGVVYNFGRFCLFVCLSVCLYDMSVGQTITFESLEVGSSYLHCTSGVSPGNTGQVRTRRSLGQAQGHKCKNVDNYPVLPQRKQACQHKAAFTQRGNSIAIHGVYNAYRAVKCAFSIGFSTTADRMAWPPSLLRDRK